MWSGVIYTHTRPRAIHTWRPISYISICSHRLQNNVEVPDDEEDEVYMDDYVLPSDVEYETEEEEDDEEDTQTTTVTESMRAETATVTATVIEKPVVTVAVAVRD